MCNRVPDPRSFESPTFHLKATQPPSDYILLMFANFESDKLLFRKDISQVSCCRKGFEQNIFVVSVCIPVFQTYYIYLELTTLFSVMGVIETVESHKRYFKWFYFYPGVRISRLILTPS